MLVILASSCQTTKASSVSPATLRFALSRTFDSRRQHRVVLFSLHDILLLSICHDPVSLHGSLACWAVFSIALGMFFGQQFVDRLRVVCRCGRTPLKLERRRRHRSQRWLGACAPPPAASTEAGAATERQVLQIALRCSLSVRDSSQPIVFPCVVPIILRIMVSDRVPHHGV